MISLYFGIRVMWVHQHNVPSYRDLVLNEISIEDRWRGTAWIRDAEKLNTERQQ